MHVYIYMCVYVFRMKRWQPPSLSPPPPPLCLVEGFCDVSILLSQANLSGLAELLEGEKELRES